jgi:hypothetical protein
MATFISLLRTVFVPRSDVGRYSSVALKEGYPQSAEAVGCDAFNFNVRRLAAEWTPEQVWG